MRGAKSLILFVCLLFTTRLTWSQASASNPWESEVRAYEKEDSLSPPVKGGIVFTGSSSIRLWKDLPQTFPNKKVLNRGIGGSEITDIIYYADRLILPYQPKKVFIFCGSNDISGGKSPEKVNEDFKILYKKIKQKLPNTKVYFISLQSAPSRKDKMQEFKRANELIKSYISLQTQDAFIDVFSLLLDEKGEPQPEFYGPDLLHMNQKGYDRWARVLKPYVEK